MTEEPDWPKDWRGIDIISGATVIYAAGVGRSSVPVEAIVEADTTSDDQYSFPALTESGRVWLRVVRRCVGSGEKERVHVAADRVTVISALPHSDVPTVADEITAKAQWNVEYHTKELAKAEARPDDWVSPCKCTRDWRTGKPVHDIEADRAEYLRYHWDKAQEVAYHRKKLKQAQLKLGRLT